MSILRNNPDKEKWGMLNSLTLLKIVQNLETAWAGIGSDWKPSHKQNLGFPTASTRACLVLCWLLQTQITDLTHPQSNPCGTRLQWTLGPIPLHRPKCQSALLDGVSMVPGPRPTSMDLEFRSIPVDPGTKPISAAGWPLQTQATTATLQLLQT